jgi:hypothetical protein
MIRSLSRTARPTVVLLATLFSCYLAIVYAFSFSQAAGASRYASNLAILLMDLVILDALLRRDARTGSAPVSVAAPLARRAVTLAAWVALVAAALLHGDYLLARYRGGEFGWTGTLDEIKGHIIWAQVAFVFCNGFLRARGHISPFHGLGRDVALVSVVALVPLASYLGRNAAEFSVLAAVEYLAFYLVWPIAALALAVLLQQLLGAARIAAPAVAALAFTFYSRPQVSAALAQPAEAPIVLAASLALAVAAIVCISAVYLADRVLTLRAAVLVCAISGAVAFSQGKWSDGPGPSASAADSSSETGNASGALEGALAARAVRRPDVFLLVYDGYPPPSVLAAYRLDAGPAKDLAARGFKVYDSAYSLFLMSRASMSALLDMRAAPRAGIGGDNTALAFFRAQGYRTHLVLNSYLLGSGQPVRADAVFPPPHRRSGVDALYRGLAGGEFKSEVVFEDSGRAEWLAAKRRVLSAEGVQPKFLYAHSAFPGHSQNSGTCLEDETERFAQRLQIANEEMSADIDTILAARRDAIIIVAGDHGPYLTGDCLYLSRYAPDDITAAHLRDRYGTLLAIRWPAPVPGGLDRTNVLQDVFHAVAAYLLESDRIWDHRLPASTAGYGGIPSGAVQDGVVTIGRDKGRPLFTDE